MSQPITLFSAHRSMSKLIPALSVIVALGQPAIAAWDDYYGIGITAGYDNNFRLTEDDPVETGILSGNFFAGAEELTQTTSLVLYADIRGDSYSDDSIDDSHALELSLTWGESLIRSEYSVDVSYLMEPTAESEQLDSGASVDASRDSADLTLAYGYDMTQLTSLLADLQFTDVQYDTDVFTDYQVATGSAGFRQRLSPRSSWSLTATFGTYEPTDDGQTDTLSGDLGYLYSTSERTTYTFTVGYAEIKGPDENEYGRTFAADISHIVDERNSFVLTIADDYQPTGNGEVRREESAEIEWLHALTDRVAFYSSLLILSADDLDYGEFDIGCGYSITREVLIEGTYTYRNQQDDIEDATSDSVYITLTSSLF